MPTYSFVISTSFSDGVNSQKLFSEIIESITSPALETIEVDNGNDNIDILFTSSLSSPQETELNSILEAHINTPLLKITTKNISINKEVNLMSYYKIKSFFYSGKLVDDLKNIKIISNIQNDTNSYDVRIYDSQSHLVIVEKNLTNTVSELNDLGTLSNIPDESTICEVQVKSNKKNQVIYIDDIILYYVRV